MQHNQKDKRTKDQILLLLDQALEQEERLTEKISSLENELSACRKKVDNPLQEFTEEALASSKISFRIDYYRTSENGPLKGIIEHLPSRTNKSFSGDGMRICSRFMAKYLPELAQAEIKTGTPNHSTAAEEMIETPPAVIPPRESLLQRLMSEFKHAEASS